MFNQVFDLLKLISFPCFRGNSASASLQAEQQNGSDTEYSSLRQSQSQTRKFFESHMSVLANNKNKITIDDRNNTYISMGVKETRQPAAESIREHARTTLGDTSQMKSIRRSTSKRSNGLATHVSFDTAPVQDVSGYDDTRPSIREHTAGNTNSCLLVFALFFFANFYKIWSCFGSPKEKSKLVAN